MKTTKAQKEGTKANKESTRAYLLKLYLFAPWCVLIRLRG